MSLHNEKRNFIRMQVKTDAKLTINGQEILLACQDLSANGARLTGNPGTEMKEGDEGTIVISSGGGASAPLTAQVRICRISRSGDIAEIAIEMLDVH